MNEHSDSKLAEGQKLRSNLAALHKDSVLLTKQKVFSYNRHNVLTSTDSLGSSAQIILLQKDLSIPIVIHNLSNLKQFLISLRWRMGHKKSHQNPIQIDYPV